MTNICVDVEGSDLGREELSLGCINFVKENKDTKLTVVGNKEKLGDIFKGYEDQIEVVHASDVLPMHIDVNKVLHSKESSMVKGIYLSKQDNIDAFVTAGSSGGFLLASTVLIQRLKGIKRPAFCGPFFTKVKGKKTVILDIGASNENSVEDLVSFAKLGRAYAQLILNIENPSLYILSNGAEEGKGIDVVVKTYDALKEMNFPNFKGNVEARDVLDGEHDVIITQGFDGNILLKSVEGTAKLMNDMIKQAFKKNFLTKLGYLLAKSGFKEMKETLDYKKAGGAMLLGLKKVCVKAHGNSDRESFYYALKVAKQMVDMKVIDKFKQEFENDGQ